MIKNSQSQGYFKSSARIVEEIAQGTPPCIAGSAQIKNTVWLGTSKRDCSVLRDFEVTVEAPLVSKSFGSSHEWSEDKYDI